MTDDHSLDEMLERLADMDGIREVNGEITLHVRVSKHKKRPHTDSLHPVNPERERAVSEDEMESLADACGWSAAVPVDVMSDFYDEDRLTTRFTVEMEDNE